MVKPGRDNDDYEIHTLSRNIYVHNNIKTTLNTPGTDAIVRRSSKPNASQALGYLSKELYACWSNCFKVSSPVRSTSRNLRKLPSKIRFQSRVRHVSKRWYSDNYSMIKMLQSGPEVMNWFFYPQRLWHYNLKQKQYDRANLHIAVSQIKKHSTRCES